MQRNAAQRLSSGFRVNSAADDAAGLAISETMRAQIRGLDQASINTQDGVGLIQTAEGAMATISDMIIRVRELMVQAANDTNTYNNREMIQEEIDQIMTEINQVTFRTQFNTRTLLAGGLGGEGGGVSSPVSLQWMVFDQARVIGLPQSGGIVTRVLPPNSRNEVAGRLPNVHYNPNNRTETAVRSNIIGLQNELNELARRVAERKVTDPNIAFTPDDLSQMFEETRDLDFGVLNLIPAERTQLQSIANRIESELRVALRAAEDMFQTTQDQINALGGSGAINFDGSTVFSGPAITNWMEDARQHLEDARAGFDQALARLNEAMAGGPGGIHAGTGEDILFGPMEEMNRAIREIVGTIGGANIGFVEHSPLPGATHVANPSFNPNLPEGTTTTTTTAPGSWTDENGDPVGAPPDPLDPPAGWTYTAGPTTTTTVDNDRFILVEDHPRNIAAAAAGNPQVVFATHRVAVDGPVGDHVLVGPGETPPLEDLRIANPNFVDGEITDENLMFLTREDYVAMRGNIILSDDEWRARATHREAVPGEDFIRSSPATHVVDGTAPGGFRLAMPGENATHIRQAVSNTKIAEQPSNNILSFKERLLDLASDVLGNVNLESNAMWFQIGPNAMQGTVLQLKGIHTGILGGGRGDLAMLIDVRERSGIPISEQLDIIDIAEGVVNGQRAQLGAVQNRLEFTRQSLDISSENLSAAESRIRDTDMAREMMRFTQAQVLQQAGISMLAQANQLPASILQLLQ